jgi:hypothetical protein
MQTAPGVLLVVIGTVLVVAGLVVMTGLFDWFGRLPGDIRIERGDSRIYIPITSMVIVSVVLSLVIQVIVRFFR